MTPPLSTDRARHGSAAASGSSEIPEFLGVEALFRDAANASDPQHFAREWASNQAFRTEHTELYLALDALRAFFRGSVSALSASQTATLTAFRSFAEGHAGSVEAVVLANLRGSLAAVSDARRERAQAVLGAIGTPPSETSAGTSPRARAASDGFRFTAINLNFHLFDREMRVLPHGLTLGVLPQDQVPGYNLSSTVALSLGAEYTFAGFRFFTDLNYTNHMTPEGATAAHFDQFGLSAGLVQYGAAQRGEGLHFSLGGRNRLGFQIGATWCTGIDGSAVSGVTCPDPVGYLSLVNDSDLISFGYGPVVASVRLLQSTNFAYFSSTHLPLSNRVPIEFGLTYYLQPLLGEPTARDPNSVLDQRVTNPEVIFDALRIAANGLQDFNTLTTEAGYEQVRDLAVRNAFGPTGSAAQYSLTNLGTFAGGLLLGFSRGSTAYRLQRDLRHGTPLQQGLILAPMLLEPVLHGINALASQPAPGDPPSLQARASYLALPITLTTGLWTGLGALGAFGNREAAIRSGDLIGHFQLAHAGSAVLGLVMILTSGDLTGSGFLGWSVLGNAYSAHPEGIDYGNQLAQYYRVVAGSTMLSYGVSGLLDWGLSRIQYMSLMNASRDGGSSSTGGSRRAMGPVEDLRIGFNTDGQSRVMGTVEGRF
ncbi:MAG: hypothetical protein U1F66_13415 [bacterium]